MQGPGWSGCSLGLVAGARKVLDESGGRIEGEDRAWDRESTVRGHTVWSRGWLAHARTRARVLTELSQGAVEQVSAITSKLIKLIKLIKPTPGGACRNAKAP